MTQYDWQLLCAKQCDKIYIIIFLKTDSYWIVTIIWLIIITLWAQMFGLDWCVVVVVWSGMININFSHENGLEWVQFGFEPIAV